MQRSWSAGLLGSVLVACGAKSTTDVHSDSTTREVPSASTPTRIATKPAPTPSASTASPTKPGKKFELGNRSYLVEQRERFDPDMSDWQTEISAEPITKAHSPLTCFDQSALLGSPVFFFTPQGDKLVVDVTAFSKLIPVNATRLSKGEQRTIGTLLRTAPKALWNIDTLVEALLRADVIRSYLHIGSELRVVGAGAIEPAGQRLELSGEHRYFTNEENIEPLHFSVDLLGDGTIVVMGLGS